MRKNPPTQRSLLTAAATAALLAACIVTTAPPATLAQDEANITMNFESVELPVFIKFISEVTGRNFVFTDRVTGSVSVVSPTPVTAHEAYVVLESVLAARGLTTIDDGVVTRIVLLKDVRTQTSGRLASGNEGGFITRMIPLSHVDAEEIALALNPLVSKEGTLTPYKATNTIIISDAAPNIARVVALVNRLDIEGHEETLEVIRLKHADAATLAEQITVTLGGGQSLRRGGDKDKAVILTRHDFKIVADERINALVVVASPNDIGRIRSLAKSLDSELQASDLRIHVYYVRFSNAEDLAEVISGMLAVRRGRKPVDSKSPTPQSGITEQLTVTADPATNSIIVNASAQDYRTIETLLKSLDIPRPQVFIEAIIVEATLDESEALGFDFQAGVDTGNGVGLARANLANLGAAFTNPASLAGLVLAATSDKTVQLPDGTEVPANVILFQALDRNSNIEVLSAPTLLTLDNQEAEILVGENIPFVTGRAASLATVQNVFTQVERQDVGIKLKVRPQVSEGDFVILEVEEEVSSVVQDQVPEISAVVGPTITIRRAQTTVSVRDGHTVVIGGLISNAVAVGVSKIPLLGDIPYLGRLFRFEAETTKKVNLIIFLTPHIIRSAEDLAVVTEDQRGRFRKHTIDPQAPLPGDPGYDQDETSAPEGGAPAASPQPVPTAMEPVLPPSAASVPAESSTQATTGAPAAVVQSTAVTASQTAVRVAAAPHHTTPQIPQTPVVRAPVVQAPVVHPPMVLAPVVLTPSALPPATNLPSSAQPAAASAATTSPPVETTRMRTKDAIEAVQDDVTAPHEVSPVVVSGAQPTTGAKPTADYAAESSWQPFAASAPRPSSEREDDDVPDAAASGAAPSGVEASTGAFPSWGN